MQNNPEDDVERLFKLERIVTAEMDKIRSEFDASLKQFAAEFYKYITNEILSRPGYGEKYDAE